MSNGEGDAAVKASAPAAGAEQLSHNLLGQRLGRKGRDTRDRIIAAAERLLANPGDTRITLSAVAREARLGMTTLYLYFSDFTELLLSVLEPIMASAETTYVGDMQTWWPDDELRERCLRFVGAYYSFWTRHARVLHLRNNFVDSAGDERLRDHRISVTMPVIKALATQMEGDPEVLLSQAFGMATVILTGFERIIAIATDESFASLTMSPGANMENLLKAQGRLLELAIRDCREANRAAATGAPAASW